MAALVYKDANGKKQRVLLATDKLSIGRHGENDVVLQDALVSRKHCLIEKRGDGFVLVDLGSSFGTFVNDERIADMKVLTFDDQIRIGNVRLKFVVETAEATSSSTFDGADTDGVNTDSGRPPLTSELDECRRLAFDISSYLASLPASAAPPVADMAAMIDRMNRTRASLADLERNRILAQTLAEVGKLIHLLKDLDTILNVTMELAVRALGADRGYILLRGDGGKLEVKVSRNMGDMRGISLSIAEEVAENGKPIVTDDAQIDPRYNRNESVAMNAIRAVMCVPLRNKDLSAIGAIYVDGRPGYSMFDQRGVGFLSGFASHAANAIESAQLAAKTAKAEEQRRKLARYLSAPVVERALEQGLDERLGGESRIVTVMFTDIRGFTSMLEKLRAVDAVEMLNDYFTEIAEEVSHEEGTLDKFLGDGVMAFWGAPNEQPDHALRAVRAALAMQKRLPTLLERWRAEKRPFLAEVGDVTTGIGIHSGEAVVGDIGSLKRREYTAIGDAVNLAARLQAIARGGEVLVTRQTLDRVEGKVEAVPCENATFKGKSQPVPIFLVKKLL